MGIQGKLRGHLRVFGSNRNRLLARGRIHFIHGSIHSYGHRLKVQSGSGITYFNSPLTNPKINVTATRIISTHNPFSNIGMMNRSMSVGIQVNGTIHKPNISLFSIPPTLTQSQILTSLLLGNSNNNPGSIINNNITGAITALNIAETGLSGKQSEGTINRIINRLGFNELGTSTQSSTDALGNRIDSNDSTSFVIGRYLSNRIYLRYTQINNLIQLKYFLSPSWAIKLSNSELGSGIDLLYTIHPKHNKNKHEHQYNRSVN
tara:strand:+ start:127 stop:912 length:786 start_codon:yes stop_codon:yes gene_type:complete